MDRPFQRKGSKSNAHVGRDFETKAHDFFAQRGLPLTTNVTVRIGINGQKPHSFDLGNTDLNVLVECKAHTWTEGGDVPSAKLTVWNEAMFFFHAAGPGFRKILFVLRDFNLKRNETLAEYYIRSFSHLIPQDVEVWEFNDVESKGGKIYP